jgi:hypothetical protein
MKRDKARAEKKDTAPCLTTRRRAPRQRGDASDHRPIWTRDVCRQSGRITHLRYRDPPMCDRSRRDVQALAHAFGGAGIESTETGNRAGSRPVAPSARTRNDDRSILGAASGVSRH